MKYKSKLLGATICPGENTILFQRGIFSQWVPTPFKCTYLNENVNCAEQAMMLAKAKFFDDMETYELIKESVHPMEQQQLGRMVKNFDFEEWTKRNVAIVSSISFDKFDQNEKLKDLLILTHPFVLVEASSHDKIWGIGYSEHDPDIFKHKRSWGENRLGQSIMAARENIING